MKRLLLSCMILFVAIFVSAQDLSIPVRVNAQGAEDCSQLTADVVELDFGNASVGETMRRAFNVTNNANAHCGIHSFSVVGPGAAQFRVPVQAGFYLGPGNQFAVVVETTPTVIGLHEATVLINAP